MTPQSIAALLGLLIPLRKSRNRYLQSRQSFYNSRNYLTSTERVERLVNNTSTNQLSTDKSIQFYGLNFGVSYKDAIKRLGKPNYVSGQHAILKRYKTVYYRISIAQVNCILQLHFVQDTFFLGLIEIRNNTPELIKEVTSLIRKKYQIEDEDWAKQIVDGHKNWIELRNDVVPYIIYQSGNPDILSMLKGQLISHNNKKKEYYDKRSSLLLDAI